MDETDIYDVETQTNLLENGEITSAEAGFMQGLGEEDEEE